MKYGVDRDSNTHLMTITELVNLFSTREQAIVLLSIVIVAVLTAFKTTRKPLLQFIKQVPKILPRLWIMFLITGIHVFLVYLTLKSLEAWSYKFIDDLILFYLIAIGLIFRACKQDFLIFRKEVSSLFVGTIFLFAILDEGTFPLTTELILLPVITFIALMQLLSKDDHMKNILNKVLAFFGWTVFLYAFFSIGKGFFLGSYEPLYEAALSIILPISFIPTLYLVYLIMEYKLLFQAVERKSMLNKKYRQMLKIGLIRYCFTNPKKLRRMRANLFLIYYHNMPPFQAAKLLSISSEFDTKPMNQY